MKQKTQKNVQDEDKEFELLRMQKDSDPTKNYKFQLLPCISANDFFMIKYMFEKLSPNSKLDSFQVTCIIITILTRIHASVHVASQDRS